MSSGLTMASFDEFEQIQSTEEYKDWFEPNYWYIITTSM